MSMRRVTPGDAEDAGHDAVRACGGEPGQQHEGRGADVLGAVVLTRAVHGGTCNDKTRVLFIGIALMCFTSASKHEAASGDQAVGAALGNAPSGVNFAELV